MRWMVSEMKELRIEIPNSQNEVIQGLLNQYLLSFSSIEMMDDKLLYIVKVKGEQTNNLLHELQARGIGDVHGNISIYQVDLYLSSKDESSSLDSSEAANVEEIVANIVDTATISWGYLSLVVLSAILAAFGLLSNSIVIIIGSMIVAPLLGPVALTSLGVLVPGRNLFNKGILAEVVGITLTVTIGFIIGLISKQIKPLIITDEMTQRAAQADPLYNIIFAIVSGMAAGLIISKGQSLSMVGVAIAASLAPPAANIGLFLSLFDFKNALLAGLLLSINILAINASCSFMFSIFKLADSSGISKRKAVQVSRNMKILTIVVILAFFYLSYIYFELLYNN